MTSGVPWSVKGIDPKARETAKDLARRSGLTLGEWLNQMIEDHGEEAPELSRPSASGSASLTEALERLSARIEAAESRSTLAISGIDQSVRGVVSRIADGEREQTAIAARFEGGLEEIANSQVRLADRLRRLEDEATGPRSAEALRALEGSLGKVAGHLYDGEAQTRAALAQVREDVAAVAGRVAAVETGSGGLIDAVVARIAERLEQAEGRTTAAMRGLEASFAHLDNRLASAEERLEAGGGAQAHAVEQRLEQLAVSLSQRVEETRSEMAEKLRATTDGRFDRMDQVLQEMTGHVQAAERNSAKAIEKMGHEVLRIAETLGRRVQGVEHRSADAIEQVGGEVARIADQLDTRLHRADTAQAQALEKLGTEIARITERLAERIGTAERRSAQAIDDVGEQVTRVTERLNQRYERSSSDLAERIRQSEERTARLLEEARERIDQRLSDGQRKLEQVATTPPAPARGAYAEAAPFADPYALPPFGQAYPSPAYAPPPAVYADAAPFGQAFAPAGFASVEPADLDAADGFGPAPRSEADFAEPDLARMAEVDDEDDDEPHDHYADIPAPAAAPSNPRTLSTRDLIEQARTAARAAALEKEGKGRKPKPQKAPKTESDRFPGLSFGAKRRKANSALKTGLLMSGAAACLALGAAGWVFIHPELGGPLPDRVARAAEQDLGLPASLQEPDTTPLPDLPRAAVALNPQPIDPTAPAPAALPATALPATAATPAAKAATPAQPSRAELEALYTDAVRRLEAKDRSGLEPLRRAANLGYAPAQFALGKAYEDGQAGLSKDFAEARRWTERAAQAGIPEAMHNLGHYYYNGDGGPKNGRVAVDWFRRAAELGYNDSQYNLGVIYEQGGVVPKNEAEAYRWYLLATRGGTEDARKQAREQVLRLGPQLSAEAKASAERIAGAFTAQPANASVQVVASAAAITTAQMALDRLGYYPGPKDGKLNLNVRAALQNYQRDQGLPVTGNLDATTATRLTPFAR